MTVRLLLIEEGNGLLIERGILAVVLGLRGVVREAREAQRFYAGGRT